MEIVKIMGTIRAVSNVIAEPDFLCGDYIRTVKTVYVEVAISEDNNLGIPADKCHVNLFAQTEEKTFSKSFELDRTPQFINTVCHKVAMVQRGDIVKIGLYKIDEGFSHQIIEFEKVL